MAAHKYVKRTGTPGNYKYWYKLPDGRVVSSDDAASPKPHAKAKREHLRKLIQGRAKGHHRMSKQEMLAHTGVTKEELDESGNKNLMANAARRGHQYEEHEIKHAHKEDEAHGHDGPEATEASRRRATENARAGEVGMDAGSGRKKAKKKSSSRRRSAEAEAEAASASAASSSRRKKVTRRAAPAAPAPTGSFMEKLTGAGFSLDEINEIMDGTKITIDGEAQGSKAGGVREMREEHHKDIIDAIIANKRAGVFEGGMKYPDFDGKPKEKWLEANGFVEVDGAGERGYKVWKNSDGVVVGGQAGDGGYMGIKGPHKEAKKFFDKLLHGGVLTYVKDVNAYQNGLGGLDDEQYAAAEAVDVGEPETGGTDVAGLLSKLKDKHGIDLGSPAAPAKKKKKKKKVAAAAAPAEDVAATTARAQAAAARAAVVSAPTSSTARELHSEDPELAAADEPLERMIREQERGGNPYLSRAKEIYHNIMGDVKPERARIAGHMLQALESLGSDVNEASLLAEYKRISGSTRIRGLSGVGADFEKATFMTLEEVMGNAPINPEVERMKRGYGAMQFARMKPYLKDSWKSGNSGAPPPMPTFGDLKTWTEHDGPKPEWAGATRTAVPKAVFDGAVRGSDGKPKYPPAWMPVHLMPAWNYIVKKSEAADQNPYQTRAPQMQGGSLRLGNQAGYQEGMAINALRKYVQMRGGPEQLVDIPSNKLSEVGLSHSDIFKAGDGDDSLKQALKHKIVDPVALLPFIKQELHSAPEDSDITKSVRFVVDDEAPAVNFRKSYVVKLSKSEMIRKIKDLKRQFVVEK